MVIFGGLLDLVLLVFLILVFAEYTKLRSKYDKAFKFIAGAALLFLLAFSFGLSVWVDMVGMSAMYGMYLFEIIGWIFLLVGTLWGAVEMVKN
jgi:hypothetical protein